MLVAFFLRVLYFFRFEIGKKMRAGRKKSDSRDGLDGVLSAKIFAQLIFVFFYKKAKENLLHHVIVHTRPHKYNHVMY